MGEPYDIAVIGGGINGCGIARDAAGRGASVALFEKSDLASGTSSASTKLIHGGLRYLEHYEFGLVREALGEREKLWSIAPHIIWPMRFVLPWQEGLRPAWLLRLGLFLYDHIGGRRELPATRTLDLRNDPAGESLKPGFAKAFEYSDAWVDDARMVVLNALDAAQHGARIETRCEVTSLRREGKVWRVMARFADGTTESVEARTLVNATGPAVLDLLATADAEPQYGVRLVRGSHIVVPQLFSHSRAYFFQNSDGRIFFAIPYENDFTLIGTTDADHVGSLDDVSISDAEIDYLLGAANSYFAKPLRKDDIVWTYAGVRPLVDDGSGRPEAASRGYKFQLDERGGVPLLSVFGGKITTFRHLAESALDRLEPFLDGLSAGKGWTGQNALPGGDFPVTGADAMCHALQSDFAFLPPDVVRRLARSYGSAARIWLEGAMHWDGLGRDFGCGLTQKEVDYLVTTEWARSAEDILWRRTKLGLRFSAEAETALADYLATEFGPISNSY